MIKKDTSGSVWDWQSGTRTFPDGTKVPLVPDSSFRVLFEHQLIAGQSPGCKRDYFDFSKVKTGPVGYIQSFVYTLEGVPLVDDQGNIVRSTYHGHVELTWEEKDD